jgi:hypothetical protein
VGDLSRVTAIRYVTPLREGGSLPGLMEADDLGTYVVKFHGAGQGPRALVAEVIAGGLATALGLATPRLVTVEVDPVLADNEPDEEVQDLLRASGGLNLGVDYLPGALDLDVAAFPIDPLFAGRILWFDALIGNVDRTWRNPNMLYWHGDAYLIDHGAALTFHHRWPSLPTQRGFDASNHALLSSAPDIDAADAVLAPRVTEEVLRDAVAAVPEEWLADATPPEDSEIRTAYLNELLARLAARTQWLPQLRDAISTNATGTSANGSGTARRPDVSTRPAWLDGGWYIQGAKP